MKGWSKILLLAGILWAFAGPARASDQITASVGNWPPYIDFSTPGQGVMAQAVKAAFAQVNIDLIVVESSWRAAEAKIDSAETVSFGWIKNADRLARWHYSNPICAARTLLLRRTEEPPLASIDQVKGHRVGWSRGYRYGDAMDRLRPAIQEIEMPSDEVGLHHLLAGKIDFMLMDENVARQLLARKFSASEAQRVVIDASPAHTVNMADLYFVCARRSPSCPPLIESFNRGLKTLNTGVTTRACGA